MEKKIYGYDFFEGNKGVVFAWDEEDARDKVAEAYGTEYVEAHKLTIKEAEEWAVDVYCTVDTWN
jgi:hypothetical protein